MIAGRADIARRVYTVATKRAVDHERISAVYGTEMPLMETAGYQVASWMYENLFDAMQRGVVVLAGPGNNGGDGYVVARWLSDWGIEVFVIGCGEPKTEAARWARDSWFASGGDILHAWPAKAPGAVVDCLLGSGISRPVTAASDPGTLIAQANLLQGCCRVAVDLPSGCLEQPEVIFQADVTCALGCLSPMHVVEPHKGFCGRVVLFSLGFETLLAQVQSGYGELVTAESAAPGLPVLEHKAASRAVVIVGGSAGMEGAALLACLGARKAGAAYIHWLQIAEEVPAAVPSEIELVRHCINHAGQVAELVENLAHAVWVLGPGLSATDGACSILDEIAQELSGSDTAVVLDAGALDWLADREGIAGVECVATPHPGEAARLAGCTVPEVQQNRLKTAAEIAQRYGCHTVLKGTDPVVYHSGRSDGLQYRVFDYDASALATAGSGDVLAGVIAALASRDKGRPLDSDLVFAAACAAVQAHQMAGAALSGRAVGGWSAREIAESVQKVMAHG